jgi:hypothetical protein
LAQLREVALHERFLLRPAPFLELTFVLYGIGNTVESLRKHQRYWPASRGIAGERPGVVLSNPRF